LDLPTELILEIIIMAIDSNGYVFAHKRCRDWSTVPRRQRESKPYHMAEDLAQPAISRVCRRLRQASLPIFYGSNKFVLRECFRHGQFENTLSGMVLWTRHMRSAGHASLIKNCVLKIDKPIEDVENYLNSICPNGPEVTLKKVPDELLEPDQTGNKQEYYKINLDGRSQLPEAQPGDRKWVVEA